MANRIPLVIANGRFQQQQAADTLSVPGPFSTPSFYEVGEIATPATPASGYGRLYAKSDNKLYFLNDLGAEVDLTASGSMAIGGSITSATAGSVLFAGAAGVLAQDNANFFWDDTNNRLGIGTAAPTAKVEIIGGALPSAAQALFVSGTLSATAATQTGARINLSSQAGATSVIGLHTSVGPGAVGNQNITNYVTLEVAGTGTRPLSTTHLQANYAGFSSSFGTTATGTNVGQFGYATLAAYNIGVAGLSYEPTNSGDSFRYVGVAGVARNFGGAGNAVGGWFGFWDFDSSEPDVGSTSWALVADNGDRAGGIFQGRDNGTDVFTIVDGGDTTIAPVSGHTSHALTITGGTLASTMNTLRATGTLPGTASQTGIVFSIGTTAGASAVYGSSLTLAAGATPATESIASLNNNAVAGTGTTPITIVSQTGNHAVYATTYGTTTGHNVGSFAAAAFGDKNYGSAGVALADKASAHNIGVVGGAQNAGAGGHRIGGLFFLPSASLEQPNTGVSAALVADNHTQALPIFLGRDAGATVFTIADYGDVTIAPVVSHPGHALTVTGDTLATTMQSLRVTGTLANPGGGSFERMAHFAVTSAGANNSGQYAVASQILAGYTGAGFTIATWSSNAAAGTGVMTAVGVEANYGGYYSATGTTAGTNVGQFAYASGSSGTNMGAAFASTSSLNAPTTNIGIHVVAQSGSSVNVAGSFILGPNTLPSFTSTALLADNGAVAAPIFVARDNGTTVFTIADGGNVSIVGALDVSSYTRTQTLVSPQTGASVTVNVADARTAYTNEGATAEVGFNLPAAAAGLEYTFIVQDTDGVQVNAQAGDTIRVGASVSASGGLAESTTVGNVLRLVAINTTEWIAVNVVGTWTVT